MSILLRLGLGCALWLVLLVAPAHAGSMYRCTGSQGEMVFSSTAVGYRDCQRLGSYSSPAPRHVAFKPHSSLEGIASAAETTAQVVVPPVVSLEGVTGAVETTAKTLPMLASIGKPGAWTYNESHDALPPALASALAPVGPDNQVLRGAVYRVLHKDGSVEYTNVPPGGAQARDVTWLFSYIATCMACNLHSPINWGSVQLNLTAYADVIRTASAESGVDEAFLRAIIHAESAFNPRAMSLKGAQGLMQLMPGTASDMGVLDAFDPAQNIHGGARYLALLLKDFNGNIRLAAAAYNAGPAAVQHYNGVPPYAETQVYVQRVIELVTRYGKARLNESGPG